MKKEEGFIVPLLVVVGFLVVAAVAYFHARHSEVALAPDTYTPEASVSAGGSVTSIGSASTYTTTHTTISARNTSEVTSKSGEELVQVTNEGTAAQRLNLKTFTNVDRSYALSFPNDWYISGSGLSVFVSNGRSSVSVSSQDISSGTTAEQFAMQNGAINGFPTKAANAYDGYEVISGNTATYYLVNGSVGYKISVTDAGDTEVLRQILLTFTYTKAR